MDRCDRIFQEKHGRRARCMKAAGHSSDCGGELAPPPDETPVVAINPEGHLAINVGGVSIDIHDGSIDAGGISIGSVSGSGGSSGDFSGGGGDFGGGGASGEF